MASDEYCEYLTEWPPRENQQQPQLPCSGGKTTVKHCVSPLVYLPSSYKIDVVLAKWWKNKKKESLCSLSLESPLSSIDSNFNPRTVLFHVSRLHKTKAFIRQRACHLLSLPRSYWTCYSLATCYHWLSGDDIDTIETALKYARLAKTLDAMEQPENEAVIQEEACLELDWLIELLERQKFVEERKKEGLLFLKDCVLRPQFFAQVERRSCSELSCEEFLQYYVETRTPVIITDLVQKITSTTWTLEHVKEVIGSKIAPLKKLTLGSIEWARLESAGECQVASFIDSLQTQGGDLCYLFDWSLPLNCPRLMEELKVPNYVSDDLLQMTPPGSLYRHSWPSLFIAPAGIVSELHVDAFASNFWMALFEGKKRWLFFPPEDLAYLYPLYHHSTDATFQIDLSDWTKAVTTHPLLSLAHPRECILEAGEFLFVPSGSPHRVENLEPSLAVSANFVNQSNYSKVMKELEVNGLVDQRAKDLYHTLKHMGCPRNRS